MFGFFKKDIEIQKLEEILKYKNFDQQITNLIFSFIYKLRDNYKDFKKTKVLVPNFSDFALKLVDLINRYIKNIKFLNFYDKNPVYTKETYDIKTKTLYIYPNEISLFKGILKLDKIELNGIDKFNIFFKDEIEKIFSDYLYLFFEENFSDFNSVAWIKTKKEKNYHHIFLYILSWILGQKNIFETILSEKIDLDKIYVKINKRYGTEYFLKFINTLFKFCVFLKYEKWHKNMHEYDINKDLKNIRSEIAKRKKNILEIPEDKVDREKDLEKLNKKIHEVNLSLKDNKLFIMLYNAYIKKNNENKISKDEYRKKINESLVKLEEKKDKYINYDESNLKLELSILNEIEKALDEGFTYINNTNQILKEEAKKALDYLKITKIMFNFLEESIKLKRNIISYLDEYMHLLIELKSHRYIMQLRDEKEENFLFETKMFEGILENLILILNKLIKLNKIRKITKNEQIDKAVIIEILKTNIIDLEDVKIEIFKRQNTLYINIYDKEIWQAETKITTKEEIELEIKEEKKYKLFK